MSVYIITRIKFDGGRPHLGQEGVIEVCSTLEIANAAAKLLTRDLWKTYGDPMAVRRGTTESTSSVGLYTAVIRLHETDMRGTTIRVSKRKYRTTMPIIEGGDPNEPAENSGVTGQAGSSQNIPTPGPIRDAELHVVNAAQTGNVQHIQVPVPVGHARNELDVLSIPPTNCFAGRYFTLEGIRQRPLDDLQVTQLIQKHGGICLTPAAGVFPGLAFVFENRAQGYVDSAEEEGYQGLTQAALFSMIAEASNIQHRPGNRHTRHDAPPPRQRPLSRSRSPAPPYPAWIRDDMATLRRRFYDDRFDCIMERVFYPDQVPRYGLYRPPPSPTDGFAPKIICLDCPEKPYAVGIGRLANFRIHHLERNVLHRQRVEARMLGEAPMDDLIDRAARIQQAIASRHNR